MYGGIFKFVLDSKTLQDVFSNRQNHLLYNQQLTSPSFHFYVVLLRLCVSIKTPCFVANKGCSVIALSLEIKGLIGLLLHPLFLSLSLHCLCEAASNQRALSSQKGHPVPLMVFWFIPSSSLPSHPSLSPPLSRREAGESLPPGCQEGAGPVGCRLMWKEKLGIGVEKMSPAQRNWEIMYSEKMDKTLCQIVFLITLQKHE